MDPKTISKVLAEYHDTYGSKLWRLSHLYKIRSKNATVIPFNFNQIQGGIIKRLENSVAEGRPFRDFFLKYRQGGVSTLLLLWWLDDALFNENRINGVLSHKQNSLQELARIYRTGYDHLPPGIKPPLVTDNQDELEFGFGAKDAAGKYAKTSRIFISLDIRSTPVHNLHISEICHCRESSIAASIAAVPPTGNITAESTANGMGNYGHLLYQDAKEGVGEWRAAFFPWFIQGEYTKPVSFAVTRTTEESKFIEGAKREYGVSISDGQILWRRDMRRTQRTLAPQEFPENDEEAFMSTGHLYFNAKKVMALLREARDEHKATPPIEQTDDYSVWDKPTYRHVYAAGADCAGDSEGDYSYLKIIDVTARKEVFRYRAKVSPQTFYKVCDRWGRYFNNALLGVERNNHGHAVLMGLDETMRYPNLFTEKDAPRARTRVVTDTTKSQGKEKVKLGWNTDTNSRPLMLDQLRHALEGEIEDDVEHFAPMWHPLDEVMFSEMLSFTEIDGKYQAAPGKNDDSIFATAIAHQMFLKLARHAGTGGIEKTLTEPMASEVYYRAD